MASNDMEHNNKILNNISLTLSAVFSPLLVPTYAFLLAVWLSVLSLAPERARLIAAIMIFLITTLLPMAVIIFLMRIGKVSDTAIDNKNERWLPFGCTILCYIGAAVYLHFVMAPHWLIGFYLGAAVIGAISMVINAWWKISAHAGSMGGLCGAMYFLTYFDLGVVPLLPWLLGIIVVSGAVCSARVYLGRHTLGQVVAGWSLGAVVDVLAMLVVARTQLL